MFDKYTTIILRGEKPPPQNSKPGSTSLLDLSTPSEEKLPPVPVELLGNQLADLGIVLVSCQHFHLSLIFFILCSKYIAE